MKKLFSLLLVLMLVLGLAACGETDHYWENNASNFETAAQGNLAQEPMVEEDGWYYSAEDVGLYLHIYGCLPDNYITKNEARELGWEGGSIEKFAPGYAIGGDKFGNREGLLPKTSGRQYFECDIDTDGGKSRGAKRIVFSNDGLIYYTEDHYESFTLLYGEERG